MWLKTAVVAARVSNNIGDRALVFALVTSMRWMIIRQQGPKHFDQHWPQPVPPGRVGGETLRLTLKQI